MAGDEDLLKDVEGVVMIKSGKERLILWPDSLIRDGDSTIIGTLSSGEDVTRRRRYEQELLKSREQMRRLATELSVSEDQERRRFATFLHDQIGQDLSVLRMMVDELAACRDWEGVKQSVIRIGEIVAHAIAEIRNLTFDLSPPILYELGLVPAIEWIGEKISEEYDLTVDFVEDGQVKVVGPDLAPLLFRSVRELLMNVVKHARASRVRITVSRKDGKILIVVEDDGIGFDVSRLQDWSPPQSFGLFSIHERIPLLGGSLVVESEPGKGTRATLLAALDCENAPQDEKSK